jgi:hypothetical protein
MWSILKKKEGSGWFSHLNLDYFLAASLDFAGQGLPLRLLKPCDPRE